MEKSQNRIKELEKDISKEDFWNDKDKKNSTLKELKRLKQSIDPFIGLTSELAEIKELLAITESGDTTSLSHLKEELQKLKNATNTFEFKSLLDKEEDVLNAIVSINAGAGRTESCDWVGILFRMYGRWGDKKKYSLGRIDYLQGEEAGIKNVTFIAINHSDDMNKLSRYHVERLRANPTSLPISQESSNEDFKDKLEICKHLQNVGRYVSMLTGRTADFFGPDSQFPGILYE